MHARSYKLPRKLWPSVEHIVIEDNEPVDGIYSEKQMRLLTEPLYSCWKGGADGRSFAALANVGMFYDAKKPPLVPDVLLSMDVRVRDLSKKVNRSYFFWVFGKSPDVTVEVVSNDEGGELTIKLKKYAEIGIPYYVVWDPECIISDRTLYVYALRKKKYELLTKLWFPEAGLGLTIWHGKFERCTADWLRWCDKSGNVIPTGDELAAEHRRKAKLARQRAKAERQRAEALEQHNERLRAQLRNLGINPANGSNGK